MAVYKASEWQGSSELWYCNDVSNLADNSGHWIHQARIWQLSPAAFIQFLIDNYKPDKISYSLDKNILIFGWKSQIKLRKYKNDLNRQARKVNYII